MTNEHQFAVTITTKIEAATPVDAALTLIGNIGKAGADKFEVIDQQTGGVYVVDLALLTSMGIIKVQNEDSAVEEPETESNEPKEA